LEYNEYANDVNDECMSVFMCVCEYRDDWYTFNAYSNVLWIHYIVDKLLLEYNEYANDVNDECMSVFMCVCEYRDDWYTFNAYSNVLWIHYVVDKLLKAKTYTATTGKSRTHTSLQRQLRNMCHELLEYNSAEELITNCAFFE